MRINMQKILKKSLTNIKIIYNFALEIFEILWKISKKILFTKTTIKQDPKKKN